FHVRIAFPAWKEESHRISLFGPERLAVLRVGDQRILHDLAHGNAARELARVGALREYPARTGFHAALAQQRRDRHPGPFAAARESVRPLHVGVGRPAAPLAAAVAGALEEMNARHRR